MEKKNMLIKFKNMSKIEVIELKENRTKCKPKIFIPRKKEIVKYFNKHPFKFVKLCGIELHWYQKILCCVCWTMYFTPSKNKLIRKYKKLKNKVKVGN